MAMTFLGGAWIHGVPARNLTDEEETRFGAVIAAEEKSTGLRLYEPVPKKTEKAAKTAKEGSES